MMPTLRREEWVTSRVEPGKLVLAGPVPAYLCIGRGIYLAKYWGQGGGGEVNGCWGKKVSFE